MEIDQALGMVLRKATVLEMPLHSNVILHFTPSRADVSAELRCLYVPYPRRPDAVHEQDAINIIPAGDGDG